MDDYPLSSYQFVVEWNGNQLSFSEVSGLSIINEVIEYKNGNSKVYSATKMPGLRKYSNIILKRGIIKDDYELYNWMKSVNHNKVERRDLLIKLLNEDHEPVRIWKVIQAWPCKLEVSDLNSSGSEVAMETIELVHEGLEISS